MCQVLPLSSAIMEWQASSLTWSLADWLPNIIQRNIQWVYIFHGSKSNHIVNSTKSAQQLWIKSLGNKQHFALATLFWHPQSAYWSSSLGIHWVEILAWSTMLARRSLMKNVLRVTEGPQTANERLGLSVFHNLLWQPCCCLWKGSPHQPILTVPSQ